MNLILYGLKLLKGLKKIVCLTSIIFRSYMFIVLGNGNMAKFWKDVLCGGLIFKVQFHMLFAMSLLNNGIMYGFWSICTWRFNWNRHMKGAVESLQFDNLMELWGSVNLGHTPDKWSWELDSFGSFSVS